MNFELKDLQPPKAAALRVILDFKLLRGFGWPFRLRQAMPAALAFL
jgi:hypothetical protein